LYNVSCSWHKIAVPVKSLQIKSKYQVLTPIIRKITTARNERKKQEHRISSLQQELKEARNSLAQSHQRFSTLVRELVDKKEKIDKSCQETKSKDKNKENDNATQKRANARKAGTNVANDKKGAKSAPVTSTPVKAQIEERNETTISSFVTSSTNNDCEDMDVCNSDETDMYQIDIVDPNDIDQIFKRKPAIKSTIPEYVSPLNFNLYER
jgi:seryl-tRNA synthetase